jgi:PAS domain S-box-containing protein
MDSGSTMPPNEDAPNGNARQLLESTVSLFRAALEQLRVAEQTVLAQAKELRQNSEELARVQSRLFDRVPFAYAVTDLRGTIEAANPAAASLLGDSPASLAGRLLTLYIAEDHRRAFGVDLSRAVTWLDNHTLRYPLLVHGTARPARLMASIEFDPQERPVRLFWIIQPEPTTA